VAEQNLELVIVSACDRPTAVRWPSGPETAASDEAARVGGRELLIVIDGEAVLSEFASGRSRRSPDCGPQM